MTEPSGLRPPLRVALFDMGSTLLEFHTGPSDDEKDEAGLDAMARHLGALDPRVTAEHLKRAFYDPWSVCFEKRKQTLEEYAIEPYLNAALEGFGLRLGRAQCVEALEQFHMPYRRHLTWDPEASELLQALRARGVVLGVVSNCYVYDEVMLGHFQHAGLRDLFDAFTFSYSLGPRKPRPEIFRQALERLGASAGEAVMVGDRLGSDVGGATAAGIQSVWLNRSASTRPAGAPKPDLEVSTLRAAVEAILAVTRANDCEPS